MDTRNQGSTHATTRAHSCPHRPRGLRRPLLRRRPLPPHHNNPNQPPCWALYLTTLCCMLLHMFPVCLLCQVCQVLLVDLLPPPPPPRPLLRLPRPILLSPKRRSAQRGSAHPRILRPWGAAVREITTKRFVRPLPLTRSPRSKEMKCQHNLN